MCTYIFRYDPDSEWPFLIAGNRDELRSRPWLPPARHWPDRADVVAGKDTLAGGTWLGLSDTGVVAAILNKKKALGPAPDKRSRGEIVLDALDHPDAVDAAKALLDANGDAVLSGFVDGAPTMSLEFKSGGNPDQCACGVMKFAASAMDAGTAELTADGVLRLNKSDSESMECFECGDLVDASRAVTWHGDGETYCNECFSQY